MPIPILMPALSPTMTEGNLVKWHKAEGDPVQPGEVLAEIETDKATMEVEAVDEGTLGKILIPAGTSEVAVNAPIGVILEEDEDAAALDEFKVEGTQQPAQPHDNLKPPTQTASPGPTPALDPSPAPAVGSQRLKASPLAKRLASQNNLSLDHIQGSGPHGRIIKRDVEAAASNVTHPGPQLRSDLSAPPVQGFFSGFEPPAAAQPISMVRGVVAKRLTESKQTMPHFYVSVDCELDALLEARKSLNAQTEERGVKISVNDILIRACALTLKQLPEANAAWGGDAVYLYDRVDVAVAVSIEGGLITPVIRDATSKGILELSQEMKGLAQRARDNQLRPEEFQGGTFTLSNMGMFGVKTFSAILNPPQACILAVGSGEQRPVIRNGTVVPATVMTVTLSVDHRVVDGAVAAKFLALFKAFVESPVTMLL